MALESPRIKAEVTEIGEFPRLAQRYNVRAVPTTVIGDRLVVVGAMDEAKLLEQVLKAAVPEKGASLEGPTTEREGEATPTEAPPQPPTGPGGRSRPPGGGIVLP